MLLRRLSISLVAIALAACASDAKKDSVDFRSDGPRKGNTLEVPPDLVSPSRDDRFGVPQTPGRGSASLSEISRGASEPTSSVRAQLADPSSGIRVARAGAQRWLVVPGTTQALWPKLRQFWQDAGFNLEKDSPDTLIMETHWAENRANIPNDGIRRLIGFVVDNLYSTNTRDRFRTRVEPGVEAGSVEIYISHRGVEESFTEREGSQMRWQPRPNDPSLEAEMLVRLMTALGAKEDVARKSIDSVKALPERAVILGDANGARLELKEGLERGWRQVGLSLDRVGLVVEDRDRAKGYYQVRYVVQQDTEQKEGFFDKLAFWRGKPDSITGQYRVAVAGDANVTTIRVLGADGVADNSESGRQILRLLHEQLK